MLLLSKKDQVTPILINSFPMLNERHSVTSPHTCNVTSLDWDKNKAGKSNKLVCCTVCVSFFVGNILKIKPIVFIMKLRLYHIWHTYLIKQPLLSCFMVYLIHQASGLIYILFLKLFFSVKLNLTRFFPLFNVLSPFKRIVLSC